MGKLGDLIVRLKLKYEDYQKGLKNAEKDTKKFESSFSKLKEAGIAVWAAIGAGVVKLGQSLVRATNQAEDAWAMFMTKAKAGWNTFVKTLLNGEWDKFIQKFKEEIAVAQLLQEALDADTEIANSIALKKSYHAEELAKLEVIARDITRSEKERAAAAEKYKKIQDEIYTQELERAKLLRKAHYQTFFPGKDESFFSENVMAMLDKALMLYGETQKVAALGGRTFSEAVAEAFVADNIDVVGDAVKKINWGLDGKISESDLSAQDTQRRIRSQIVKYFKEQMKAANISIEGVFVEGLLRDFFKSYELNKNGDEVQSLIASLLGVSDAKAAYKEVTKKMDLLLARVGDHVAESAERIGLLDKLGGIEAPAIQMDLPDIIPDDWLERNREKIDAALAEAERLQGITQEINNAIVDTLAQSLSGATEAFVNAIMGIEGADASQVMAAFLEPFANTAKSLGELLVAEGIAIELAKKTMENPFAGGGAMIAAGVSLIAIGSALAAGIQAIGRGASGSTASSYSGDSSAANTETFKSELTVYVEGRISGKDIILSGNKTLNSWNR